MEKKTLEQRGYILIIFSGICWGLLGAFTKLIGTYNIDSLSIAAFRPTIALSFYLIVTLIKNPKDLKTDFKGIILFIIYGIVAYNGLFVGFAYAVELTTPATAVILLYTAPIFITILSYFFFKEPITLKKFIALALTALGCFLVVEGYKPGTFQVNKAGILWGLLSAIAFAMQNVLGKIILKDYSHRTLLVYGFLFSALFLWILRPPWVLATKITSLMPFLFILGIGILSTIIPNGLHVEALKYVEASKAGILSNIEPLTGVLLAFIIFKERLEFFQWLGMGLIIFALVLIQYQPKEKWVKNIE